MDLKVSILACRGSAVGPKHSLKVGPRWVMIESRRGEAAIMLSTPGCVNEGEGGAEAADKPKGSPHLNAVFFFFRMGGDPATDGGEWVTLDGGRSQDIGVSASKAGPSCVKEVVEMSQLP